NVAGYDFPKLLTGSMGSLGVIVELTLKTRPRPEATAILWTTWPGADRVDSALGILNTSRSRPVAVELLNGPAAEAIARSAGLDLPTGGAVLAVGVEGAADVVTWQLDVLGDELKGAGDRAALRDGEAGRAWDALTDHPASESAMTFKANLRPSALAGLVAS